MPLMPTNAIAYPMLHFMNLFSISDRSGKQLVAQSADRYWFTEMRADYAPTPGSCRPEPRSRRDFNNVTIAQVRCWIAEKPGYAADLVVIFSANLVSAIARMKRCVLSTKARLSARQLSSSTPTP